MKLRPIASAKVNWTLEVLRRRDDGYHDLRTVLQTLRLHDTIVLSSSDHLDLHVTGDVDPSRPAQQDLAYRAADALRQEAGKPDLGALIELEKVVPAAAGLGGGSSNAAAVLRGLNRLWEIDLDPTRLQQIGAALGSDVPFFLTGGTALCSGRGDEVAPLADIPPLSLTIAVPRQRPEQKTAQMYRRLRPDHFTLGEHTQRLVDKLTTGEPPSDDDVFNAFETVPFDSAPLAALLKEECEERGACGHLAGSGPALFFLSPLEAGTRQRLERAGITLFDTATATASESTACEEL
jgi:4-diphosphocytidyl-2-C-methyl-D-erythritol kinase